jgi:hypothetical protein
MMSRRSEQTQSDRATRWPIRMPRITGPEPMTGLLGVKTDQFAPTYSSLPPECSASGCSCVAETLRIPSAFLGSAGRVRINGRKTAIGGDCDLQ